MRLKMSRSLIKDLTMSDFTKESAEALERILDEEYEIERKIKEEEYGNKEIRNTILGEQESDS